jgi:inorganic phosphate transporter, PiT family
LASDHRRATLFVAYANGANDNFKGLATLFGSGIVNG